MTGLSSAFAESSSSSFSSSQLASLPGFSITITTTSRQDDDYDSTTAPSTRPGTLVALAKSSLMQPCKAGRGASSEYSYPVMRVYPVLLPNRPPRRSRPRNWPLCPGFRLRLRRRRARTTTTTALPPRQRGLVPW